MHGWIVRIYFALVLVEAQRRGCDVAVIVL